MYYCRVLSYRSGINAMRICRQKNLGVSLSLTTIYDNQESRSRLRYVNVEFADKKSRQFKIVSFQAGIGSPL